MSVRVQRLDPAEVRRFPARQNQCGL